MAKNEKMVRTVPTEEQPRYQSSGIPLNPIGQSLGFRYPGPFHVH